MNRTKFVRGDKLLPVIKHGFLRSEENVFPAIFEHPQSVWENVFLYNFQYLCMVGIITMLLPCFVCDFFSTLRLKHLSQIKEITHKTWQ